MGKRLQSADDVEWMRRGLAIAAVEGGRRDYRDTIVSLVLLRYAAQRVDLSFDPLFLQIQGSRIHRPRKQAPLRNARTHAAPDVASTVATYGPKDWVDEVNRE